MRAIIAKNSLSFIGVGKTGLPWRSKEDLLHFKELTKNNVLIAGHNTYESILSAVKGFVKENEGISFDMPDNRIVMKDRDNIIIEPDNWIVGGKATYEKYCHLFTELHISHIDNNTIGDVMFPNLSNLNKDCKIFNYYFKEE